jgi:hypothetical protein
MSLEIPGKRFRNSMSAISFCTPGKSHYGGKSQGKQGIP